MVEQVEAISLNFLEHGGTVQNSIKNKCMMWTQDQLGGKEEYRCLQWQNICHRSELLKFIGSMRIVNSRE